MLKLLSLRTLLSNALMLSASVSFGQVSPGIQVRSESVIYDPTADQVKFQIEFDRVPDFYRVDQYGRQQDEFQYYIVYDPSHWTDPFGIQRSPQVLVRGGEIHFEGQLPIRGGEHCNDSITCDLPRSGGWGGVRGSVTYQQMGSVLTFTVPRSVLGDPDGRFAYTLHTVYYGETSDNVRGRALPLPIPYGDLNGDGKLTVDDVRLSIRFAMGLFPPTRFSYPQMTPLAPLSTDKVIADINQDEIVNLIDSILILRRVVGITTPPP